MDGVQYDFPVCDDCGASAPSVEAWNKRTITTHMRKQMNNFAGTDVIVGLEVAMRSTVDLATDKEMAELVGVETTAEYDDLMATDGWDTELGRWKNLKNGYWEHKRTADF